MTLYEQLSIPSRHSNIIYYNSDATITTFNTHVLLGVSNSAKLNNFNSTERYRRDQSLSFRDDGSIVLKYESTTIIKNGARAVVKGTLINTFNEDRDQNIKHTQEFFTNALKKIKSTYNINKDVYDESTPILTIKYVKIIKMLIEESLDDSDSHVQANSDPDKLRKSVVLPPIPDDVSNS